MKKRILTAIVLVTLSMSATAFADGFFDWDARMEAADQRRDAKKYLKKQGYKNPSDAQVQAEIATGKYIKKETEESSQKKIEKAKAEAAKPPTRAEATKVSCKDGVLTLRSEYIKQTGAIFDIWQDVTETRQLLPSGVLKGTDVENKLTLYVRPEVPLMIMSDEDKSLSFYVIDPDKTGAEGGTYLANYATNKAFNEKYCASESQTVFYKDSGIPVYRMRWYTFAPAKDSQKDNVHGNRDYMGNSTYNEIINRLVRSVSKDPEAILEYFAKNKDKQEALDAELSAFFNSHSKIAPTVKAIEAPPVQKAEPVISYNPNDPICKIDNMLLSDSAFRKKSMTCNK